MELCTRLADIEDVVYASPNFTSQYQRQSAIPAAQWHLRNLALERGQKKHEDINALEAWERTQGDPSVVVAVLDDGVDVSHPDLRARIRRHPGGKGSRDRIGRDFTIPNSRPGHFDPRPKRFTRESTAERENDVHGTATAGVIAAAGAGSCGIAPRVSILPIRIFSATELADDERVADAILYAAEHAQILCCPWTGPFSEVVHRALTYASSVARQGRGSPLFCAAGNGCGAPVAFPASHPDAIAVGASTDRGYLAAYSNVGKEVAFVAPSSGGTQGVFTTTVSPSGRRLPGGVGEEGAATLHTESFGGTSAAAAEAAGVGSLLLSIRSDYSSDEVRGILQETARPIDGHDGLTHDDGVGFGRLDAARALAAAS